MIRALGGPADGKFLDDHGPTAFVRPDRSVGNPVDAEALPADIAMYPQRYRQMPFVVGGIDATFTFTNH